MNTQNSRLRFGSGNDADDVAEDSPEEAPKKKPKAKAKRKAKAKAKRSKQDDQEYYTSAYGCIQAVPDS